MCLSSLDQDTTRYFGSLRGDADGGDESDYRRDDAPAGRPVISENQDTSKYMEKARSESLVHILFDIFLYDRLELLDDAMSYRHLKVIPETQVNVIAKGDTYIFDKHYSVSSTKW